MLCNTPFRPVAFVVALLLVSWAALDGRGCAVAPPRGARVEIAEESAILVWDSTSKTQHFIRRASFNRSNGVRDFGFIVPTPSSPELAEADDKAFQVLERATAPRTVVERHPIDIVPKFGCSATAPAPSVQVLHEQRVAGYDAVILEAKGADDLGQWLKKHDYDFPDSMKEWADAYVRRGWKFTAFKVGRDGNGERLATSAVRMSFRTNRPFFPYREPTERGASGKRLLRVYFVSHARYRGTLEGAPWPGQVVWANRLGWEREAVLAGVALPPDTKPQEWWLTELEDRSAPRPGHEDVFFELDQNQVTVERPVTVVWTEPGVLDYFLAVSTQGICCCSGPLLVVAIVWARRRRVRPELDV